MKEKKVKVASTKCDGCGDDMEFSPENACLQCPSCGSKHLIMVQKQYAKHDVVGDKTLDDENQKLKSDNRVMGCPNCGSEIMLTGLKVASQCPYCKTNLVSIKSEEEGKTPDAIIPFAIGKEKAKQIFKQKLTKNWLVPSKFKKNINADGIQAYYFPAFVFDANCHTSYSGVVYEEYRDREGKTKTRDYPVRGTINTTHNGLEIEASSRLEQFELGYVRPYNLSQAVAYTSEFVAGFPLECYNTSTKDCYVSAQGIIKKDIRNKIIDGLRCDGVRSLTLNTTFIDPKYSYFVFPMYRINYQYKNKKYSNVMNGQTGALGGKMPKSGFKIALCVLIPILLVALPIIISLLV